MSILLHRKAEIPILTGRTLSALYRAIKTLFSNRRATSIISITFGGTISERSMPRSVTTLSKRRRNGLTASMLVSTIDPMVREIPISTLKHIWKGNRHGAQNMLLRLWLWQL